MNGVCAHEVIIECPNHETNMSPACSVDNIREVLWVYRDRLVDLKRDPRLVHGLIFKNQGTPAGAPLAGTFPFATDRHARRADLGVGGNDGLARVL